MSQSDPCSTFTTCHAIPHVREPCFRLLRMVVLSIDHTFTETAANLMLPCMRWPEVREALHADHIFLNVHGLVLGN